ncbi:GNAT family N-acetyltransferase [Streptomyces sp. cmx-18-6]
MTERTICLDADPRDWRSRKIGVRPSRWYATVELDRDGYVDAATARGDSAELPAAYDEAVDRVRSAAVDRLWYEGYTGDFVWTSGPRWITLCAPYPEVEAAIEGLRVAELEHDYSRLHAIADRLALPVDEWLAPGERELVRGVDFTSSPGVFLRFLRSKAKRSGLRLHGRATTGSVWVRPTLPAAQKQLREMFPEQHPGWVDRWSGHVEPDDAPLRPWVGGREQDLSYGAAPVRFRTVNTPANSACGCGMSLKGDWDGGREHAVHHAAWALGLRIPKNLDWLGDMAVVTTQSPIMWRRLAYQVARMPQKENHYDFRSWSHIGEPRETEDNVRAYLSKANGYVIGYLAAHDAGRHRPWDLVHSSRYGDEDNTSRPSIDLVWVADAYRRQGVGATLVQALADDFGCQVTDVSWSTPVSDAGRHLARRVSPKGIWVN